MSQIHVDPNRANPETRESIWPVAFPVAAILLGHFAVDVLAAIVPSLLGVVEKTYLFSEYTSALLYGTGSVVSGLSQPLFAWISDRWNTRICGGLGVLLGGAGIAFIGFVPISWPWLVFVLYALGMCGIGMFHPIAASTIGRLSGNQTKFAISWFFVCGMAGGFSGSLLGPKLGTGHTPLVGLAILIAPAIVVALALHLAIRKVEHRGMVPSKGTGREGEAPGYDWRSIISLYVASILRFMVNLSLNYLLVRWVQQRVAAANPNWGGGDVAAFASPLIGQYYACVMLGMAAGGLLAGSAIRIGAEKTPMILVPILFSPAIWMLGWIEPGYAGFVCCFLAALGFASMVPVTITLAQRLMPGHTSLASGMVLGGAWCIGSSGPVLSQWIYAKFGLTTAFAVVGCLLALAGIIATGINRDSIQKV